MDMNLVLSSFLILFKPTAGGNVKAKTLGNLVRATAAVQEALVKTLIVTSSEPHGPASSFASHLVYHLDKNDYWPE